MKANEYTKGNKPLKTAKDKASQLAQTPGIYGQFQLIYRYVISNNNRNYRSFVIGLTTVVLVVTFLSLIQNTLIRSNVVFLKLSEDTVGQVDLLLNPNNGSLFNYTYINTRLKNIPVIHGSAPRWLIPVNITAPDPNTWDDPGIDNVTTIAYLLIIDSLLERQIGAGTAWPHRALGEAEAHVTGSLLRSLKRRPQSGDRINININLSSLISQFVGGTSPTNTIVPQEGFNVTLSSAQVTQAAFLLGVSRAQLLQDAEQLPNDQYRIRLGAGINGLPTNTLNTFTQPLTVIDAIDKPQGKYPQVLGNVIVMDLQPTEILIKRTLTQLIANPVIATALNMSIADIRSFHMSDYAMSVVSTVKDRDALYARNRVDRQRSLNRISDLMFKQLGWEFNSDVTNALNQALNATQFIQIYMNEIFFTVMAILSLLAIILIYSLLLTDIDEKTFEFGMLRMLGMRQQSLIGLVALQSMLFSVPGIGIGLLICAVLYVPIEYVLSTFSAVPMSFGMDSSAITLGVTVGFIVPLFGMLLPIRRALSHTLRDALDMLHNSTNDTRVIITKLRDVGVNINETIISLLLVIVGFLVYYVIPLSFTFNDLPLFFRILTIILLGMVIGQVLICQAMQHTLEKLAIKLVILILNGTGQRQFAIIDLVSKNLGAHARRNSKTALMMSLLLAYIIFAAVQFRAQADTISQTLEWQYGADIVIRGVSFAQPIPEARVSNFLVNQYAVSTVLGWTFIAYPINSYWPVNTIRLGPVTSLQNPNVRLVGVQSNLLDVAFKQYFFPLSTYGDLNSFNVMRHLDDQVPADQSALYKSSPFTIPDPTLILSSDLIPDTPNITIAYGNVLPVIISEALTNRAFIGPKTGNLVVEIDYRESDSVQVITQSLLTRALSIARKVPGIGGISRFVQSRSPVLISMARVKSIYDQVDQWSGAKLSESTNAGGTEPVDTRVQTSIIPDMQVSVPKQTALIRLRPGLTSLQVEGLINDLNAAIGDQKIRVDSLRSQLEATELAAFFINVLFYIVAFVGILLAFFVLWLSFTANLRENAWEMGVLRAIGLDSRTVISLYVYEAVGVVLATILLGSTIGIVTAVTLTLQFGLFTEMPFSLTFPGSLYTTVIFASLGVAVMGSYVPAKEYAKKKIALALKGL